MHIPKTGGKSVNRLAEDLLGKEFCVQHLETRFFWPDGLLPREDIRYVSGHLSFSQVKPWLPNDSEWGVSAVVRNPFTHLVSHLSWVRNLHMKPFRYERTPWEFKDLCEKLNRIDFSDLVEVRGLLEGLPPRVFSVFDNCQTRYFSRFEEGIAVDERVCEQALAAAQSYEVIGLFENMHSFLREIYRRLDIENRTIEEPPHINQHNPKIIDECSDLPGLLELLAPMIHYDQVLYDALKMGVAKNHAKA